MTGEAEQGTLPEEMVAGALTEMARLGETAAKAAVTLMQQIRHSIGVSLLHGEQPCDCLGPGCAGEALAW